MPSPLPIPLLLLLSAFTVVAAGCSHRTLPEQAPVVDPLAAYRLGTQRALASCSEADPNSHSTSLLEHPPTGFGRCVANARTESTRKLRAALPTIHTPELRSALQAYHNAFLEALDAIPARPEESSPAHSLRFQYLVHKTSHAWTRFEMLES
ncbi:hypothetical protein [Ramlibacter sp.]|uniref:hypothetical protein n=1 Tax=Ramlibacter sp. TaxID=1917967 RepID=UPI0026272FF2|nr:hypothetical protein [Ramlibacter sp.]MDB5954731.1 hypothetical protein [Ramlibacter sp.]